ncbi:TetR/AcrR family transcriptional regulator [Rhodococcus erythropolis]|uniref:TetR/AcrR family transcriptional regulator n=1 Tax=Rhodococcus erythropolis TaxID=1833 RepID=UPI00222698D3|nr:TetR/AcrR family transcriptional regulator [Rhodococcus erythropolis]MCW2298109.1 AcrR family transcriptional regulator [Rhodococcus erythropolis]
MKHTEPVATRDKERTRRAILDAAERVFTKRGSNVSLTDIAEAAGVTQSGLRHHFRNREALIYGVIEHSISLMWEEVRAHIDLSENRPGKFLRGYVRALTGDSDQLATALDPTALIAALGTPPEVESLYARDAEKWNAALNADGLPRERVLVIQYAAEGLAVARSSPYLTSEDLALARAELLALTEQT